MNPTKAPKLPAELDMPNRLEGLLFLLIASPMAQLGCNTDPLPIDTEGSSSTGPSSGGTSSGVADSSSSGGGGPSSSSSDDGTTSTGSSSSSGSSDSGTTEVPPSTSTGPDTSSSSGGEESTTGGAGQGNTCERVGDLMDMCYGYGAGYWYEFECTNAITGFIADGNVVCAQAYNDLYSCIADLDCAEVFNGWWNACAVQYEALDALDCWGSGGTTFGGETESGGWSDSGWWGSDSGGGASGDSGWWGGSTTGGWEDSGFSDDGSNFIQPPGSTT